MMFGEDVNDPRSVATMIADYTAAFPEPCTAEWGRMNRVRAALIRKKVRGELAADEVPLYQLLQRRSLEVVEAKFPFTPLSRDGV